MAQAAKLRGKFWPQDNWGRIANAAVPREQITRIAHDCSEEAADLALERFGDKLHSVYVSGPAARRRPGGAVYYVLLRHGAPTATADMEARSNWESIAAAQLRRRHPRIGRVKVRVVDWKSVFTNDGGFSPARFALAVNSICIAGRNMTRMLSPQRLDAAVANRDILRLRARLLNATARLTSAKTPERVQLAAMDAGHAILGAAFALILEREQTYTEDLDLMRDLFTLNYPGRMREMTQLYALSTRPPTDAMKALTVIDRAARWITPMTDAWLNANNPQRAVRLRA